MLTVKIAKLATIHDRFCACASDFLDGDLRLSESPVTSTARSLLPARPSAPRETPRQNRDLRCSIYAPTTRLTAPGISRVENPRTFTDPNRSLRFPQSLTPTRSWALWFAGGDQLPLRQLRSTQIKPFPDPAPIPASAPLCPNTQAPQTPCPSASPEDCER